MLEVNCRIECPIDLVFLRIGGRSRINFSIRSLGHYYYKFEGTIRTDRYLIRSENRINDLQSISGK